MYLVDKWTNKNYMLYTNSWTKEELLIPKSWETLVLNEAKVYKMGCWIPYPLSLLDIPILPYNNLSKWEI